MDVLAPVVCAPALVGGRIVDGSVVHTFFLLYVAHHLCYVPTFVALEFYQKFVASPLWFDVELEACGDDRLATVFLQSLFRS